MLNRTWHMEQQDGGGGSTAPAAGTTATPPAATSTATTPPAGGAEDPAQSEIAKLRKEAASYRRKLRETEEANRKREQDALAEQGKFKELAEQRQKELEAKEKELEPLRAFRSQHEEREAEERARREAQVAQDFGTLPEAVRADVPADAPAAVKEAVIKAYRVAAGRPPTSTAAAPRTAATEQPVVALTDAEAVEMYLPGTSKERKAELQAKLAKVRAQAQ